MLHIGMVIAFDGAKFNGYQSSPGIRSVERTIFDALQTVTRSKVTHFSASGRTDAGVSAHYQVCSFDLDLDHLEARRWTYGISAILKGEIRVLGMSEMPDDFHARHSRHIKQYRYHVTSHSCPNLSENSWQIGVSLSLQDMREAASYFEGQHSFQAFRDKDCAAKSVVRTILLSDISNPEPGTFIYRVVGCGFLMHMVRIMIGTLVEVGQGKRSVSSVRSLLHPDSVRIDAGQTAPPRPLTLDWIRYDDEGYESLLRSGLAVICAEK